MRKLLAILLNATIACNGLVETIESFNKILDYFELDKEAIELDFLPAIGDFFKGIWDKIKSGIKLLDQKGLWGTVVHLAKTAGKKAAKAFCEDVGKIDGCENIVDSILEKLL